jgi:hypothetical protein
MSGHNHDAARPHFRAYIHRLIGQQAPSSLQGHADASRNWCGLEGVCHGAAVGCSWHGLELVRLRLGLDVPGADWSWCASAYGHTPKFQDSWRRFKVLICFRCRWGFVWRWGSKESFTDSFALSSA